LGIKKGGFMHGIKEAKEILVFTEVLAVFVAKRLADGAGFDDATALVLKVLQDEEFKAAALAAWDDASKAGSEIADLDVAEFGELSSLAIKLVVSVLSALKAPKV
jgi:hypothetical protein